jgi:hypothetical protein
MESGGMHNAIVLIYFLLLSACLSFSQYAEGSAGNDQEKIIECLGVLANGQNPTTLVIAFFGLVVALKFGAEPTKKALNKAKKYIRTRDAV